MKNQYGLNEEKNFIGKILSQLSACNMTHVVSLGTNNQALVFKESGDVSEEAFHFLTIFSTFTHSFRYNLQTVLLSRYV